ncbi:MAG: hypothetical protein WBA01_09585, partial [Phormidesmis sp.]
PRLNIQFELTRETLVIYGPDGSRFLTFVELGQQLDEKSQQLDEKSQQLDESQAENARLIAKLRALGVDPSA